MGVTPPTIPGLKIVAVKLPLGGNPVHLGSHFLKAAMDFLTATMLMRALANVAHLQCSPIP